MVIILNIIDFEKIVGQERALQLLKNIIKSDQIGHAYLFSGKEGIGKRTTAIVFAKAINCTNLSDDFNPCNSCASCLKIEQGIHPDFQIISPINSVITIGQIKNIKEIIYWKPLTGRKKIFLIDDAHKMTVEASNSILKILEEPPEYAILILITHSPGSILPTIVSRCHQISFQPISATKQKEVLDGMNMRLDDSQWQEIVLLSAGSLSKAIELASDPLKMQEKDRYIEWLLKTKPEQRIIQFFSSSENEVKDILNSFLDFVEIMVLWFRDIMFFQLGLAQEILSFPGHIDNIKKYAQYYTQEKIILILNYLTETPQRTERNIRPEILLENFIMQLGD